VAGDCAVQTIGSAISTRVDLFAITDQQKSWRLLGPVLIAVSAESPTLTPDVSREFHMELQQKLSDVLAPSGRS
jgi:hypothetical protein